MFNRTLILLIALLVSTAANAADSICNTASQVNPNRLEGGIGGTGAPENSGIGGTGIIEHGGIGGTGITGDYSELLPDNNQGGIAIMGVVTGFASICVNGEEVHYNNATPVFDNGKPTKLGHLAVGKTVMLKADRVNGRLNARAIGMYDAVAGPIGRMDIARQQLQVMGQTVRLNQAVMQQVNALPSNANVRVSGHRLESGEVVATRVDIAQSPAATTMGTVTEVSSQRITVNGTQVNVSDLKLRGQLNVGSEVRVSGDWSGKALNAKQIDIQPTQRLIQRADQAILEGYVQRDGNANIKLSGITLSQKQQAVETSKNQSKEQLVKVELKRNEHGGWIADKVEERKGRMFDNLKIDSHEKDKDKDKQNLNDNTEQNSDQKSESKIENKEYTSESNVSSANSGSGHGSGHSSDSVSRDSSSGGNRESGSSSGGRDSTLRSTGSSHGGSRERVESSSRSSGSGSSDRQERHSGKSKE